MRRLLFLAVVAVTVVISHAIAAPGLARPTLPLPNARPLPAPAGSTNAPQGPAKTIVVGVALADIGFKNGLRLGNLGARREIFVQLPQHPSVRVAELALSYDDLTAHKAQRNLEVLVNDRSVAAIPLEGDGVGRTLRVPLAGSQVRDGFIKLTFLYSGAATQDRCIDVRVVGDSLTIRPESAITVEFDAVRMRDVATVAAMMPREVAVVLPERALSAQELAAALTVSRALAATGRRAVFAADFGQDSEPVDAEGRLRWIRGTIAIGAHVTGAIPADPGAMGTLGVIQVGGMPALLLSDVTTSVRAARMLATPTLAAARGLPQITVADLAGPQLPTDRVTFDQLGLRSAPAEVYGRAELLATLDIRSLPADTRPTRLALDVLVAPDGAEDKAVLSLFVNGRFLASTVAASEGSTRIDQPLPDGLVGAVASIQVVVQRRSASGECRYEAQGYPAQILGSSTVTLAASATPRDFADLATRWTNGVEVLVPPDAAQNPLRVLPLLADVLGALSPEIAPLRVRFAEASAAPSAPFLAVSAAPPGGASPRVRFDRGRVAVEDRSGRTLLDLGGFRHGAVAQLVEAGTHPGIWLKALSADGQLPAPASVKLEHGDVAFVDDTGVALAMSTERDTLIRISYPEQTSWLMVSARFQSWIVGALWLLATLVFLFTLQRLLRSGRRSASR